MKARTRVSIYLKEKKMTNYDVVKKLVGEIMPVGDTNVDNKRLGNLESLTVLVNLLIMDIDDIVHRNKTRQEDSIKKAVKFADKFLKDDLGIKE